VLPVPLGRIPALGRPNRARRPMFCVEGLGGGAHVDFTRRPGSSKRRRKRLVPRARARPRKAPSRKLSPAVYRAIAASSADTAPSDRTRRRPRQAAYIGNKGENLSTRLSPG